MDEATDNKFPTADSSSATSNVPEDIKSGDEKN